MKTLIATDGSQEATTALRTASRLLRKNRNEFEVLRVAPELVRPVGRGKEHRAKGSPTGEEYRRRIARKTKAILDDAAKILGTEGVEAKLFPEIGSPADVIVKLAEGYDVTVVYAWQCLGQGCVAGALFGCSGQAPGVMPFQTSLFR